MKSGTRIVLVAVAAGIVGAVAGLWFNGSDPLLRSDLGQRTLQQAISATAPPAPAGLAVAKRGETIPTLQLPDLDGRIIELPAAHLGRPQLINFWASWCGPCIEEMPELDRFAASQAADGTQVVGIALDEAAAVAAFLQKVPVNYPILIDAAGPADSGVQLGNLRGVLPYTVLLDGQGRLVKQKIGPFRPGEIDHWVRQ
ncbi:MULTISPECIES: redoxin family protein [unclassified Lysobacter]